MSGIGRPKKKSAEEYILDNPHQPNEWWTEDQIHAHADAMIKFYRLNQLAFVATKYLTQQGIPPSTYRRWITGNDYFGKKWELVKAICSERCQEYGCSKDFNASMFRFILKNAHGWRDDPPNEDIDDHDLDPSEYGDV